MIRRTLAAVGARRRGRIGAGGGARLRGPRGAGIALAWLLAGCPAPEPTPDPIIDPLSRPAEPTLDVADLRPSSDCQSCHPDHVERWSRSAHAYAIDDPVFQALVGVRQQDHGGAQDTFCMQCHTIPGVRGGIVTPGFDFDALTGVVREGVTCVVCHQAASVERPWNAGLSMDPGGPMRGPIADPAATDAHGSVGASFVQDSAFCAACHDVVELNGLNLERPYEEWLESPSAEAGETCQDCHMPASQGQAAEGGATRTVHDHGFVGVDVPLLPGWVSPDEEAELEAEVAALLTGAGRVELAASPADGQIDLFVTVHNELRGHALPTGTTMIRQVWLEVTATDGAGQVLYRTGHLDDLGDLRDHWSALDPYGDDDLLVFSSGLLGPDGQPELFPWRATEHRTHALAPGYSRTSTLFVPVPAGAVGPVQVVARLRFRTHPPFLLRALGLDDLVDRVRTYEIDERTLSVPLP